MIALNIYLYLLSCLQALCINEYKGLEFNCDGAGNTACLRTGAEVLKTLSFDDHTVSYPVFGLGMLMIGFLVVAFYVLSATQLTFMPLGHTGAGYVRVYGQPAVSTAVPSEKESAPEEEKYNEMLAQKNADLESGLSVGDKEKSLI